MDLRTAPFGLDAGGVAWVRETLASLSVDEKLGQVFCLEARSADLRQVDLNLGLIQPGAYLFHPAPAADILRANRHLQAGARIPMLLPASLEMGGCGIALEGTLFGTQLQVAATGDEEVAYRLGLVSGREGRAVGCNWSFSPDVDIAFNCLNPATGTRTFGSDPETVLRMARATMRGLHESGMAATLKHWPGDGVDERDQHLVTTVNSLGADEWEASYGRVYRGLIKAGADAIMSAHIMLPAWSRRLAPGVSDENLMPASLARELNVDLLRGRLGFNGLIISDATSMAGFTIPMRREESLPGCIQAGCDMLLFNMSLEEDARIMREGLERGLLTPQRLDAAVTRILALKASLGLHQDGAAVPAEDAPAAVRSADHLAWAADCADRSVTLVKDRQRLLPLRVDRHRRIYLHVLGDEPGFRDSQTAGSGRRFAEQLRARGFEVTSFQAPEGIEGRWRASEQPLCELRDRYDLIVYLANVTNRGVETVGRITWTPPMGFDVPKFPLEVPTLFVSMANPYHLQDVPRMQTFVNAYTGSAPVIEALVAKLVGDSPFRGVSPVDPTGGHCDATF